MNLYLNVVQKTILAAFATISILVVFLYRPTYHYETANLRISIIEYCDSKYGVRPSRNLFPKDLPSSYADPFREKQTCLNDYGVTDFRETVFYSLMPLVLGVMFALVFSSKRV